MGYKNLKAAALSFDSVSAQPKLTWCESWHRPFESHISIAWRVMRANALRSRRFRHQFLDKAAQCSLGRGAIIQEISVVQQVLGMMKPIYCPIHESDYIQVERPEQFFSRRLRICPACSKSQYHSNLFQINGVARCPIHHEILTTSCPECGVALSTFSLTEVTLGARWGCGKCGWPHHQQNENIFISVDEQNHVRMCFEPFASLVRKIGDVANNAPWLKDLQYGGHHISRACAYRIAAHWLGAPLEVTAAIGPDVDFPLHVALPRTRTVASRDSDVSQAKRLAYVHTHRKILRTITQTLGRANLYSLFDAAAWWTWDPTFACHSPARVDIPKQVIAYRWWRTAFEHTRESLEPSNADEDTIMLKTTEPQLEEAMQGERYLWGHYFHLAYRVFEILAGRWQQEINSLLGEQKWSETTVRSYFTKAWDDHVAGICTFPHSNLPIKVVSILDGEESQLPPGSVLFFCTIPVNYMRIFP